MSTLEQVIEGCRAGDASMQRELYRRYSPRFYALCRRYAVDDGIAQEMLVEGFLVIFRNMDSYRGEGPFEGWMYTIILRTAIAIYHRERKNSDLYVELDQADNSAVRDTTIQDIDLRNALLEALRSITADERAIFNLVAVEGYNFVEAGELLKQSVSTTKSQYYRAQTKLQTLLRKRLGENYLKALNMSNSIL